MDSGDESEARPGRGVVCCRAVTAAAPDCLLALLPPPLAWQVCVLGDHKHCEEAAAIGVDAMTVDDLKKLNKNKKLVGGAVGRWGRGLVGAGARRVVGRCSVDTSQKAGGWGIGEVVVVVVVGTVCSAELAEMPSDGGTSSSGSCGSSSRSSLGALACSSRSGSSRGGSGTWVSCNHRMSGCQRRPGAAPARRPAAAAAAAPAAVCLVAPHCPSTAPPWPTCTAPPLPPCTP